MSRPRPLSTLHRWTPVATRPNVARQRDQLTMALYEQKWRMVGNRREGTFGAVAAWVDEVVNWVPILPGNVDA